jgi:hypothetical protein
MHEKALNCIIVEGQKNHEIRDDIGEKELIRVIIGSIRYTVKKWRLSGFNFDLKKEIEIILNSLKNMLVTK